MQESSKIHFFTDVDLLKAQTEDEAWGPVKGSLTNKFRLCSKHTSNVGSLPEFLNPRAFAICKSSVIYQPNSQDSNLLNLLLKPDSDVDLLGYPIKYFIYRGVLKESLFYSNPNGEIDLKLSKQYTDEDKFSVIKNGLFVNKTIDLNNVNTNLAEPGSKGTGMAYKAVTDVLKNKRLDTDPVFSAFNKEPSDEEFPYTVKAGHFLGEFKKDDFSLEIVLESGNEDITFGYLRSVNGGYHDFTISKSDHILDVSTIVDNNSKKEVRQEIHSSMDPVAFFSAFTMQKKIFYNKCDVFTSGNAIDKTKTGVFEKIYNSKFEILYKYCITKFYNKTKIYIYLQDSIGRCLYNNSIYSNETTVKMDFSYEKAYKCEEPVFNNVPILTNEWPIIILSNNTILVGAKNNQGAIKLRVGFGSASITQEFKQYAYCIGSGIFYDKNYGIISKDSTKNPETRFIHRIDKASILSTGFTEVTNNEISWKNNDIVLATPFLNLENGNTLLSYCHIARIANQLNINRLEDTNSINGLFTLNELNNYYKWFKTMNGNYLYLFTGRTKLVIGDLNDTHTDTGILEACIAVDYIDNTNNNSGRISIFLTQVQYYNEDLHLNNLDSMTNDLFINSHSSRNTVPSIFKILTKFNPDTSLLKNYYLLEKISLPAPYLQFRNSSKFIPKEDKAIVFFSISVKEFNDTIISLANLNLSKAFFGIKWESYIELPDYKSIKKFKAIIFNSENTYEFINTKPNNTSETVFLIGDKNIFCSNAALEMESPNNYQTISTKFGIIIDDLTQRDLFTKTIALLNKWERQHPQKNGEIKDVTAYQQIKYYEDNGFKQKTHEYSSKDSNNIYAEITLKPHIKLKFDNSVVDYAASTHHEPYKAQFYLGGALLSADRFLSFNKNFMETAPKKPDKLLFPLQAQDDIKHASDERNLHNHFLYFKLNTGTSGIDFPPNPDGTPTYSHYLYTDADKAKNIPRDGKFYFVAKDFKEASNEENAIFKAFTVEEAKERGIGAIDREITITINSNYIDTVDVDGGEISTTKWDNFDNAPIRKETPNPNVCRLASVLAHEFGHILSAIENGLENLLFENLQSYYSYKLSHNTGVITPVLAENDYTSGLTIRKHCEDNHFNFARGGGHLKGSITGYKSCLYEKDFGLWFQKTHTKSILEAGSSKNDYENGLIYVGAIVPNDQGKQGTYCECNL